MPMLRKIQLGWNCFEDCERFVLESRLLRWT